MPESGPYDVVLLPEQRVFDLAIETSAQLDDPKEFTLGDTVTLPHVTVYMLQIHRQRLHDVTAALHKITSNNPAIHGNARRLYIDRSGYVDVEYDVTEDFLGMQELVVEALNPLRDGMRSKDRARMAEATGVMRHNYETYGWKSIGELYRPHLTLTKYAEEPDLPPLDVKDFSCVFPALGLVAMGNHGTAAQLIERFEFRG